MRPGEDDPVRQCGQQGLSARQYGHRISNSALLPSSDRRTFARHCATVHLCCLVTETEREEARSLLESDAQYKCPFCVPPDASPFSTSAPLVAYASVVTNSKLLRKWEAMSTPFASHEQAVGFAGSVCVRVDGGHLQRGKVCSPGGQTDGKHVVAHVQLAGGTSPSMYVFGKGAREVRIPCESA